MATEQNWNTQWIHSDSKLSPHSGITYSLRYIAAVPILVSIKSVDLGTRTKIAKLSIHRVCHEVGLQLPPLSIPDKLSKSFIGSPDLNWAMTAVYLTITSQALTVSCVESGKFMFRHNLSTVSFASGGDAESMDFICYVAKTDPNKRMCFVFECPNKLAQDVIVTVGQAFQLGYQDFKHSQNPSLDNARNLANVNPNHILSLPGDRSVTDNENSLDRKHHENGSVSKHPPPNCSLIDISPSVAFNNLMDCDESSWLLGNEAPNGQISTPNSYSTSAPNCCQDPKLSIPDLEILKLQLEDKIESQPNESQPKLKRKPTNKNVSMEHHFSRLEPVGEPWYVGKMSRLQAESLLRYDGDFLVRASIQQPGQFVLSGLQDGRCKHLLLADPNGQVRTKDSVFDSIQHLIDYHVQSGIPICSSDSEIKLIFPVSTHIL